MSKMISYEEVDKQQLIDWIESAHDILDEKDVKDNEHGALYSIYGRLGFYIKDTDAKIAALTARLQEAEAVIKSGQVLVLKMYEVYDDSQYRAAFSLLHDHQGKYSGKTWTKEQDDFTARAAAWLKGGTE